MDTITGHIERITFQNAGNGLTAARLQESKSKMLSFHDQWKNAEVLVGSIKAVSMVLNNDQGF